MYLGIDLGTSNSAIAGIVDGKLRVFRPADGGEVLPSIIYFDKRGHRLYGRRAHDQALVAPENVAAGFKRLMGTSTPIEIKGVELTLTPEECSAEIIRQLLGQAATEVAFTDPGFDGARDRSGIAAHRAVKQFIPVWIRGIASQKQWASFAGLHEE